MDSLPNRWSGLFAEGILSCRDTDEWAAFVKVSGSLTSRSTADWRSEARRRGIEATVRRPGPRGPSGTRSPLDRATYRRIVGTLMHSRWMSGSAELNPAAPAGGLVALGFVTIMNGIRYVHERWTNRPYGQSTHPRPLLLSPAPSGSEAGTLVKLLFLAALVGGISAWFVVTPPAHETTALLLAWMAFVCLCLLE
jgi:hypothetical protein